MEIEDFYSDGLIKSFLQDFPAQDWPAILKKLIYHGISSYKSLQALGFPVSKQVPGLKLHLENFKVVKAKDSNRQNTPNRSTSHSNFQKKSSGSHSCRHTSQYKSAGKSFKFDRQPPAKKLVGKELCTKERKPTTLGFQSHIFTVDECEKRGSSSAYSSFPSESFKKAFSSELKPAERLIPKLLKPVELKQAKPHNTSSTSAQVFCSSSEISD
jgi:hypothetical protein